MREEYLLGWLCIMRLNWGCNNRFNLPTIVKAGMEERGWIECSPRGARLTDAGVAASDLVAPEWGIDPIPSEGELETSD